jgi:hypothetical protein
MGISAPLPSMAAGMTWMPLQSESGATTQWVLHKGPSCQGCADDAGIVEQLSRDDLSAGVQ